MGPSCCITENRKFTSICPLTLRLTIFLSTSSTIRITFENISSLPIDFLRLTFDDSTIAPAQQALAEGELSVFDTYETEYDLIHRPVFTWDSKRNPQLVAPGEKVVVAVNCHGKAGWYVVPSILDTPYI